jgi:hypothetical protein
MSIQKPLRSIAIHACLLTAIAVLGAPPRASAQCAGGDYLCPDQSGCCPSGTICGTGSNGCDYSSCCDSSSPSNDPPSSSCPGGSYDCGDGSGCCPSGTICGTGSNGCDYGSCCSDGGGGETSSCPGGSYECSDGSGCCPSGTICGTGSNGCDYGACCDASGPISSDVDTCPANTYLCSDASGCCPAGTICGTGSNGCDSGSCCDPANGGSSIPNVQRGGGAGSPSVTNDPGAYHGVGGITHEGDYACSDEPTTSCAVRFCVTEDVSSCYYEVDGEHFDCNGCTTAESLQDCAKRAVDSCDDGDDDSSGCSTLGGHAGPSAVWVALALVAMARRRRA